MKLCLLNIIGLLLLTGIGSVIGQNKKPSKLDNIIEHYGNLSKAYNEKTLNGVLTNVTDELPKCKLPPTNANYYYYAINSQDYNFYPREGEYVGEYTILLVKCNGYVLGGPFDENIDDVVACENGTWSHRIKCQTRSREPVVDICSSSLCGPDSQCKNNEGSPVCSCLPGFIGNPPDCKPECIINKDCPIDKACINNRCTNPCIGTCGVNTTCIVIGHAPICTCVAGYIGDPFDVCYPMPPLGNTQSADPCIPFPCGINAQCNDAVCKCEPNYHGDPYVGCVPECVISSDCPADKLCDSRHKCIDPCLGSCGKNASCKVIDHKVICSCPPGHVGNPFVGCRPECILNVDCPNNKACIRDQCEDPCIETCGRNSVCEVTNHIPVCNCPPGQFGDPLVECKPECIINAECPKDKKCRNNKCVDPCPGLCGKNAKCDVVNHAPICHCPPGQYGNPLKECKAECFSNIDCPNVKACINYKCTDPCPGSCGKNAICDVFNHRPVCSCPPNSDGDAFVECKSECGINSDCLNEKACINNKCIDPCIGTCGEEAKCTVINHAPVCHCPPNLTGNPFIKCKSISITSTTYKPPATSTILPAATSTATYKPPATSTILPAVTSTTTSPRIPENTCFTPPYPKNGSYLTNGMMKQEGQKVFPFTVLTYTCDPGFVPNSEHPVSVCFENKWVPEIECKRLCENLVSYTLDLTCTYQGGRIDCDGPMKDGVIVTMACKRYHQKPKRTPLKPLTCKNGVWSGRLQRCDPDCGEDKSKSQAYAIGAAVAEPNTAPWHIGIYEKSGSTCEYRCGGTIVSNKVIISAAHCFTHDSNEFTRHDKYKIAVGKYYSNWTDERDDENEYVQKLDVEKVYIPETYGGQNLLMQSDLAIIIVKDVIEFSNSVHAACVDLDSLFAAVQLSHGKTGKVVGWGVTQEGNIHSVSNELRQSLVPVVNRATCRKGVPETFKRYTQVGDKFCAGALEGGPTVCSGDSGGGFMVSVRERDIDKWYLFGIVSAGPIDDISRSTCKSNTYTIYTDVTKHSDYIEDIIYEYGA